MQREEDTVEADGLFAAAERVLRAVGIERGQTCLDFGCGRGNYTIPLARLVGPEGSVYALDKDAGALEELAERAREASLENIGRIDSSSDAKIGLEDDAVDAVLLYDVLHSHYFTAERRKALFDEIDRVASPEATLSVFPNHMEPEEIEGEVVRRAASIGFRMVAEYRGPVAHDKGTTEGHILTFRRSDR